MLKLQPSGQSKSSTEWTKVTEGFMRILIADDHNLVRESLAEVMSKDDMAAIELAEDLKTAMEIVRTQEKFDLILLDYNMPGMNRLDGLERMMALAGETPVAILSGTASSTVANRAIEMGAAGFVPKTLSARSMISATKFMIEGEIFAPIDVIKNASKEAEGPLSRRELDVLRGLCDGKSNKEIARDMDLQEVTIKLHVKTLSRKLEARNRTHAAMIARDRSLI